jgi:RsiW-degrading membrane proteinase PrsW (M82 family)
MIGMGFATLENILYVNSYGIETAMVRMFTAVPAHAAFAVIMGYYVGLAKFEQRKSEEQKLLFIGFIGAVLLHGAYDYFLFQKIYEGLAVLAFVSLIAGIYYGRDLIKRHQEDSPFKEGKEHVKNNL